MKKTITKAAKPQSVRLKTHVQPVRYSITLHPDLEAHTFRGDETISLAIAKPVCEITLHSLELMISGASIAFGKETLTADAISYDEKAETATFHFAKSVPAGKAKLALSWDGILKDNMRGFYKSRYEVDGMERFMATTQFEATDARRCIPCFDEPAQKAVFDVSLVIGNDKTAISNTLPIATKDHSAGFKVVSFAPTPKMSTYLLAFIVGDFEALEQKTASGVLVRVLTVPGKSHQAQFSLETTVRCLEFYEDYFKIKYPLDTLDMIAVPDFASLAMENWGAITFREVGLLVDEANTSTDSKELIAEVIAHELAHQWFGNLVTMEWWTHLWLNEGFASYVPYLALEKLFPERHSWEEFATYTLAGALKLDALHHTHPVEVEVHHPNDIGEIFDAVSYLKGASVIRMLAEYIGDKDFRKGLSAYLKKHSYANANTEDLWDAFEKASGKPVKKMMAVWTGKSGYPVISVEKKGAKLSFSQKRFYSSIASAKKATDTTVWPVPVSFVTEKGETKTDLMTKKRLSIQASSAWVKLNAHEGSLYRVRYDEESLLALAAPIREQTLPYMDRLGVIRDMFSLAEAGEYETITALEFSGLYTDETEFVVWSEIVTGFRTVANLIAREPYYEEYRAYARSLFGGIAQKMGWEFVDGESHSDTMLRPLVLGAASFFGDTDVVREALRRFENRSKSPIHPDLRGVVYAAYARSGGEKDYEILLAMYRAEKLSEEQNRILGALGFFKQKSLIMRTLEFILTDEVRLQDRNGAFASVIVNPHGRDMGWAFIKKNWKKIGDAYGEGNHLLSRLVGVLNRNTTKEAYDDIKKFFKTHKAPGAERTIEQTLEQIDSNIRWLKRDGKKIGKWLAK